MDSGGAATGVINDYFGNGVATVSGGSVTWSPTHVGSYGPLPDSTATPLTDATQLAQATVWRGHRIDPTGFYWIGKRYYEPTSGRWLSPDPLGFAASTSLYEFSGNDPLNYFDADGRIFGTGLSFTEFFGAAFSGAGQGAVSYGQGLGQGLANVATGTVNAVAHPINTVDNVANGLGTVAGNLVYNTSDTLSAAGNGIVNTVTNPNALGNAVGNVVGGVALGAGVAQGAQALSTLGDASTIFYSGKGALSAAETLAESTGGQTLATSPYAVAAGATQDEVVSASQALAENASGDVQVVQAASGVRTASVWATTEYPTLMQNPAVTSLTYQTIDESGNIISTITEANPIAQSAFAQSSLLYGAGVLGATQANNAAGQHHCNN